MKERVLKWQHSNPMGSKAQCSKDLKLSYYKVSELWDLTLDKRSKEIATHSNDFYEYVHNYQIEHPLNSKKECSKELEISYTTVLKHWDNSIDLRNENIANKSRNFKVEIETYQLTNPLNCPKKCSIDLNMQQRTVSKYFNYEIYNKNQKEHLKEVKKIIADWIKENPMGTMKDCAKSNNISYNLVKENWNSKKIISKNKIIKQWQANNPRQGICKCIKETGFCYRTVKKYWKEDNDEKRRN